jgi:hypothetical protein
MAIYGGAVFAGSGYIASGAVNITDTSFINCSVDGQGGAVSAGSANITDTSFINCSSGDPGGALQLGNATLTNCTFAGCHTCTFADPNAPTCHTGEAPGGAISSSNQLTIEGCKFALPEDQSRGHNDISASSVTFACPPGTKGSSRNVPGPLEPKQLPPSTEILHCV